MSNAAKRELKAKYFKLCEKVVLAEGTGTWGETSIEKIRKVSMEMCNAGMGDIAAQEYNNLIQLYKDLGHTMDNCEDE